MGPGNKFAFHMDQEVSVTDYNSLQKSTKLFLSQKQIYRAVLFWNMDIYEEYDHYKFNV